MRSVMADFVAAGAIMFVWFCSPRGGGTVGDFLIVMGAVMFVAFIGLAYVWFSTPPRDSKRDH